MQRFWRTAPGPCLNSSRGESSLQDERDRVQLVNEVPRLPMVEISELTQTTVRGGTDLD